MLQRMRSKWQTARFSIFEKTKTKVKKMKIVASRMNVQQRKKHDFTNCFYTNLPSFSFNISVDSYRDFGAQKSAQVRGRGVCFYSSLTSKTWFIIRFSLVCLFLIFRIIIFNACLCFV